MSLRASLAYFAFLSLAACQPAITGDGTGTSDDRPDVTTSNDTISSADEAITACQHNNGKAYTKLSPDSTYYLTTFGGPQDTYSTGTMSCGGKADGVSFYIADRQRFELDPAQNNGKHCGGPRIVKITGTDSQGITRCVYAKAADYGPAQCVEDAAGKEVIDASPAIAKYLFHVSLSGWSDHRVVTAVPAEDGAMPGTDCVVTAGTSGSSGSTPTEPVPPKSAGETTGTGTSCVSSSFTDAQGNGLVMQIQECVQSKQDKRWYQCTPKGWTVLNQSFAQGSQDALLKGGDAGPCTLTHAL
jgi:hypothetical protein